MIQNFDQLLHHALTIKGKQVIVIFPDNDATFSAVKDVQEMKLASFVLIGDKKLIQQKFDNTTGIDILHHPTPLDSLQAAIDVVRSGKGDILMKGGIETSTMMKALLQEQASIRTGQLLSDIFIFEFPQRKGNKLIMITDGGVTIAPDLMKKVELINNAVEVAHALGNTMPKVAVLSATEFIIPNLQSTLDAAVLSKMNERGQIKGCIVDGPLALDNAISEEAAAEKRLNSPVAGKAEILIAPSIEAANNLAKGTTYFAGLRLAHVIVGGKVPILIPSRADKSDAKVLSVALGIIMSDYLRPRAA